MARKDDFTSNLFSGPDSSQRPNVGPLAERLRPRSFADLVGQDELVGPGRPLRKAIESDQLSSLIFWGPPGCGKTTLALLIARHTKAHFVSFSAVTSGIPELREIVKMAEHRLANSRQKTLLFVDEIHRFNKAQQDAFLPHLERGTIILIGATTENPSFEVIAPLLSRSLVLILQPLSDDALNRILGHAVADAEFGLGNLQITITDEARRRLINLANGDARSLLTALEFVAGQAALGSDGTTRLDEAVVEAALLKNPCAMTRREGNTTILSPRISRACGIQIPTVHSTGSHGCWKPEKTPNSSLDAS
jgi:putative ATPase